VLCMVVERKLNFSTEKVLQKGNISDICQS
jgi:hypothetical protein